VEGRGIAMRSKARQRDEGTHVLLPESGENISLKLETQDCTTNPEIFPRKAEFPIFDKLRITGLFLEKQTYT